jgi:phosphatidylinositol 4-kinase
LSKTLSIHNFNVINQKEGGRKDHIFLSNVFTNKIPPEILTNSLAGYSLFCYIFQIKDRHNGNILFNLNREIVHIDFGYILNISPGNFNFEASSFKMSREFLLAVGGKKGEQFEKLREKFILSYFCTRINFGKILSLCRVISQEGKKKNLTSFNLRKLQERFHLDKCHKECLKLCSNLFADSINDWRTIQYDKYQLYSSGIK